MALSVDTVWQADGVLLVVAGEVDQGNVAVLRRAVDAALLARPATLYFDLIQVTYLDSLGIGALLAARTAAAAQGSPVLITGMHPSVRSVLQMTALLPLFIAEPPVHTGPTAGNSDDPDGDPPDVASRPRTPTAGPDSPPRHCDEPDNTGTGVTPDPDPRPPAG